MDILDFENILKNKDRIINELRLEVERLEKENNCLKKELYLDELTNIHNRRILDDVTDFDSIIMGDIDYFKNINDQYGHIKGDEVLIEVRNILSKYIRDTDIVCRWGGEEFVILLKNCDDEEAYEKALYLKEKISELKEKFGFDITMSFGISNFLLEKPLKDAIDEADRALYKSKVMGRNKVTMYKE